MTAPLVTALGRATTDFYGGLPRLPGFETGQELAEVSVQLGGGAAIACVTATRLGCRARFFGKLANDFLGQRALAALADAGVDASHALSGDGRMSPFTFTAVGRDDRRRIGFTTEGDVPPLAAGEVPIEPLLDGCAAVLLDGSAPAAQTALAEAARKRNIPVVLDIGELREGIGELIAVADVLLSSERLASEIAPRGELQDSLLEMQRLGPRAVVITLGESGSIGLHGDQLVRQPALMIDAVDTTGAGHVYHGAFAAALVQGEPFTRCIEFASIAAGLSCKALGGVASLPDMDAVRPHLQD